ncbi:hypothetical protein C8Q80DRAFT_1145540 [Daedaleopsis nitida]|nr:hypothetical protein C8Q80DRAFT_1145540 [Daedaleopsis nitida]
MQRTHVGPFRSCMIYPIPSFYDSAVASWRMPISREVTMQTKTSTSITKTYLRDRYVSEPSVSAHDDDTRLLGFFDADQRSLCTPDTSSYVWQDAPHRYKSLLPRDASDAYNALEDASLAKTCISFEYRAGLALLNACSVCNVPASECVSLWLWGPSSSDPIATFAPYTPSMLPSITPLSSSIGTTFTAPSQASPTTISSSHVPSLLPTSSVPPPTSPSANTSPVWSTEMPRSSSVSSTTNIPQPISTSRSTPPDTSSTSGTTSLSANPTTNFEGDEQSHSMAGSPNTGEEVAIAIVCILVVLLSMTVCYIWRRRRTVKHLSAFIDTRTDMLTLPETTLDAVPSAQIICSPTHEEESPAGHMDMHRNRTRALSDGRSKTATSFNQNPFPLLKTTHSPPPSSSTSQMPFTRACPVSESTGLVDPMSYVIPLSPPYLRSPEGRIASDAPLSPATTGNLQKSLHPYQAPSPIHTTHVYSPANESACSSTRLTDKTSLGELMRSATQSRPPPYTGRVAPDEAVVLDREDAGSIAPPMYSRY